MRAEQRDATREQIVSAALVAISEAGFDGVSTRSIAARANVSQGLLTYHFKSKDLLWRAAAEHLFSLVNGTIEEVLNAADGLVQAEVQRELIRQIVYLNASHPEFMRFMLDQGRDDNERSRWLSETYVRPLYKLFSEVMSHIPKSERPHAFYAIAGATGVIYCSAHECKRVTGLNPGSKSAIERHAEFVARLFVPENDS